jgi:lysyl-tRNA synthetase class II
MSSNLNDYLRIENWYSTTYEMKQAAAIRPNRIDVPLMAALRDGLPSSAVLGIGLDRLLMIAFGTRDISDVRSFPYTSIFNKTEAQPCYP